MVYSKAAVTPVNHCFTNKNLKERCYLHSVQQGYEKNSCKPGIKYFTSVNCQFTLVNWWFTLVNCHFTVNRHFTVDRYKRPFAEDSNFFHLFLSCAKNLSAAQTSSFNGFGSKNQS